MRMNLDHVASGDFALGRDVLWEFDYWPLAVSMPPTKVVVGRTFENSKVRSFTKASIVRMLTSNMGGAK